MGRGKVITQQKFCCLSFGGDAHYIRPQEGPVSWRIPMMMSWKWWLKHKCMSQTEPEATRSELTTSPLWADSHPEEMWKLFPPNGWPFAFFCTLNFGVNLNLFSFTCLRFFACLIFSINVTPPAGVCWALGCLAKLLSKEKQALCRDILQMIHRAETLVSNGGIFFNLLFFICLFIYL